MRDDLGAVGGQEFGDFGQAMADQIMQHGPRQRSDPMGAITQNSRTKGGLGMRKVLHALHVNRGAAQETGLDHVAHPDGLRVELQVVPSSNAQPFGFGKADDLFCLGGGDGKGFFHVHVTPGFQAHLPKSEVTLSGSCNMNDVWLD